MTTLFGTKTAAGAARWYEDGAAAGDGAGGEKRGERRALLRLTGELMTDDRAVHPMCTLDVSASAVRIACDAKLAIGSMISLRIEDLGQFRGEVVRTTDDGQAVRLTMTEGRRAKVAGYIEYRMARANPDPSAPQRRHERIVPLCGLAEIEIDGVRRMARIANVSVSGAAVATDLRPPVGKAVRIGSRAATVARHTADGIGLSFEVDIPDADFGPTVML